MFVSFWLIMVFGLGFAEFCFRFGLVFPVFGCLVVCYEFVCMYID